MSLISRACRLASGFSKCPSLHSASSIVLPSSSYSCFLLPSCFNHSPSAQFFHRQHLYLPHRTFSLSENHSESKHPDSTENGKPAKDTSAELVVPLNFYKISAKEPLDSPQIPVIVLHGVLANSATYRSLLKRKSFAPHSDSYALDLRNHGSSPHVSFMDYDSMAKDVLGFMDDEGISTAHIFGHSAGGKVGMNLALIAPKRVSSLAVIDILPIDYSEDSENSDASISIRAINAIDLDKPYRSRQEVSDALKENGLVNDQVRDFVMTNLTTDEDRPSSYKWKINPSYLKDALPKLVTFPSFTPDVTYAGPTLLIRGANSKFCLDKSLPFMQKLFPNVKVVTVDNANHWVQAEKPEKVAEIFSCFIYNEST